MKNKLLLLILILILSIGANSQNRVSFDYDQAGNQIRRYVCVNCNGRVTVADTVSNPSETIVSQDLKMDTKTKFSYYPNPVLEELNISWQNDEKDIISNIEVYTMTGQFIKKYNSLEATQTIAISFLNEPQGFYNVVIYYNNGEKRSIKIVKK